MKIGIISDTHNQIELIRKALALFKHEEVGMIIHVGDMDMASVLEEFKEVEVPIKMVIGNIDEEPERFIEKAKDLRLDFFLNSFLNFEVDGKCFFVFHGNVLGGLGRVIKTLVESKKYDVIIYGHTHRPRNETVAPSTFSTSSNRGSSGPVGGVLVLNPGSLEPLSVGVRPSVAVYDVGTGKAEIVSL